MSPLFPCLLALALFGSAGGAGAFCRDRSPFVLLGPGCAELKEMGQCDVRFVANMCALTCGFPFPPLCPIDGREKGRVDRYCDILIDQVKGYPVSEGDIEILVADELEEANPHYANCCVAQVSCPSPYLAH